MESLQRHSVFCVQGGGLYIYDGTVVLVKCDVHSNEADVELGPNIFIKDDTIWLCTFGTTLEGVHGTVDNDCAAPPPSPPALGPPEASFVNDPRAVGGGGAAFHFRGPVHTERPGKKHVLAKKVEN